MFQICFAGHYSRLFLHQFDGVLFWMGVTELLAQELPKENGIVQKAHCELHVMVSGHLRSYVTSSLLTVSFSWRFHSPWVQKFWIFRQFYEEVLILELVSIQRWWYFNVLSWASPLPQLSVKEVTCLLYMMNAKYVVYDLPLSMVI